ncbi:MAG: zinc-dependent alcohol dehydrogenase family protein [Planctomycetes bacterium]|nr:zinc-dependent alcohol dehydrogenase family protein [Planctomycetota bacterium]
MKAIVFDQCGEPAEVLQLRDLPEPTPARHQVRVRMLASPINPSDLLFIRGQYGRKPALPASPGFEGVGIVEESGGGLLGWRVLGRRVAVLGALSGTWREQVLVPATQAVPVPADLPDEQAAAFFVNPATALVMTRHVLRVPRSAWLLQTAAGSALGRMVIRLGKREGFRTINVVRRREQGDELLCEGADVVVCTADESIGERVRELTGGAGVPFALDAVGGATGSEVVTTLAPGGRMLVYGTLSGEPLSLDPRVLIVGQKRVEGFWLGEWIARQGLLTKLGLVRRIGRLMSAGVLTSPIAATYPMDKIQEAVRAADQPGKPGKVIVRISPPSLPS